MKPDQGEGKNRISVIVPTLNEAGNIDSLLMAILAHAGEASLDLEVLVVDDGSTDGTRERVRAWQEAHPVLLIAREGERGLAGAVLAGARAASGEVVVVMDADLSHPPEKIAELARPILEKTSDLVIGSRYVPGGSTSGWPLSRWVVSRAAASLAWVMADVRDPLSGFFALSRERILEAGIQAVGFKIGLEVLLRGGDGIRVQEVPIAFQDRAAGRSKMGWSVIGAYLRQLAVLAGGPVSTVSAVRLGLAGLAAAFLDFLVFQILFTAGVEFRPANLVSFFAAMGVSYLLISRSANVEGRWGPRPRYLPFAAVALMALFLRGGVFALLTKTGGWSPTLALIPGILAASVINYLGWAFYVFSPPASGRDDGRRWRLAAVGILAYAVVVRLAYLGVVDLLPEEAYYWNYSQHLDLSYLDHPPMVAWLIKVGTVLFGHSEFAVRIGAMACWLAALLFSYLLARNLSGKDAAFRSVLLLGALPFFFGIGFFMTPDAPLVACWAGALYFLERALLGNRRWAWFGAGACLGLGLLSKYSMGLVAISTLIYLLSNRQSRRWFLRPQPYAALLIAALLFSPVILWNAEHGWASFLFQGPKRWHRAPRFDLPELLGFILLTITPLGVLGFLLGSLRKPRGEAAPSSATAFLAGPRRLFVLLYTLVPLSVFVLSSLRNETKIQWTGPVWLAALPAMALTMLVPPAPLVRMPGILLQRIWKPAILTLVVGYAAALHVAVLGCPVIDLPRNYFTMSWRDLGRQIEEIESEVVARTGDEPLIVGMDKYHLSSAVAFYDPNSDGQLETAGVHLFGSTSLMYEYWFPPKLQEGKNLVLIGGKPGDLTSEAVRARVDGIEPVRDLLVKRNGVVVGRYYACVAYGYHSLPHYSE